METLKGPDCTCLDALPKGAKNGVTPPPPRVLLGALYRQ